eukprot:6947266-Prymnesium_polylepis.1
MNSILREQFVALHSPALLEQLLTSFRTRYACAHPDPATGAPCHRAKLKGTCEAEGCCRVNWGVADLDLPERGDLDLDK